MKRIKRKQLKADEFVSTVTRVIEFAKNRTRELLIGAAGLATVVLLILAVLMIRGYGAKKQNRILSRILQIETELEAGPEKLTEMESLAGSGKYSRLAYLKLAAYWYEQNDFDKALEYVDMFPPGRKDLQYYQSQDLKARIHINRSEWDDAIAIYRKMRDEDPEQYATDLILFNLASALEAKGETAEALDVYRSVQEDFPQTYSGYEAGQKVRELEEKK